MKWTIIKVILFFIMCSMAFAQSSAVIVTGAGATEAEAKNNAFVLAIEQAIGVMVSSDVLIKNGELIEERIKTRSDGFIKNYSMLSSGKAGDLYNVTIRAEVAQEALTKELEIITGTEIDVDGASTAASIATKQKLYSDYVEDFKTQKAEHLLKLFYGAFDVNIINTAFDHEQAGDKIPFSVTVQVSINEERAAAAIAELDKELIALGAKKIRADPVGETINYRIMLRHLRGFTFIDYNFSKALYQIVEAYFIETIRKRFYIVVAFLTSDGEYSYTEWSGRPVGWGGGGNSMNIFFDKPENIVLTGTIPIQVLENTTSIAAKIDLTKLLDYLMP